MTSPSGFDPDDVPVDTTIDPDLAPPAPRIDHSVGFADQSDEPFYEEDRTVVGQLIDTTPEEVHRDERLVLTHEERQNLASLLTIGSRYKTVSVMGHNVIIRTLKATDEMRIGLFTKPYLDSQGFARAYQTAVCGAGVVEIINQPLWESFKEVTDPQEIFTRNTEALGEFRPVVITKIYQEIMDYEREFANLLIKLNLLGDPEKKLTG